MLIYTVNEQRRWRRINFGQALVLKYRTFPHGFSNIGRAPIRMNADVDVQTRYVESTSIGSWFSMLERNPCLVDELVEGVLAVGTRLAEVDLTGLEVQQRAVDGHALAS
jgi:hypothetical protein